MKHEFLNKIPTLDMIKVDEMLGFPKPREEFLLARNDFAGRLELRFSDRLVAWLNYERIELGGLDVFVLWLKRSPYLDEVDVDRLVPG